jgi:hypothetical protein
MKQFCLIQKCVHCDSWPLVSLIPAGTSRTSSMSHQKTDGFHSEGWFTMLGIQHFHFCFLFATELQLYYEFKIFGVCLCQARAEPTVAKASSAAATIPQEDTSQHGIIDVEDF